MSAFYNEIDPYAAAWLRNLIKAGHIAPGIVDERSIEDIRPDELVGYTQCHFFAGVGVWSYALRRAGWNDTRPVWTGSCPCQPFSSAGTGAGFADERHLWPAFQHLISECEPPVVIGEQVASKDADPWLDLVQTDLEGLGYAFGALAFPSAGVGAPHIRDRTYWVANTDRTRLQGIGRGHHKQIATCESGSAQGGTALRLANTYPNGCSSHSIPALHDSEHYAEPCSHILGLAYPDNSRRERRWPSKTSDGQNTPRIELKRFCDAGIERAGPTNGYWQAADWLACRDGKWRPVESGASPLVNGVAGRLVRGRPDWHAPAGKEGFGHRAGRLKGYGNAINAEAAHEFIIATANSFLGDEDSTYEQSFARTI